MFSLLLKNLISVVCFFFDIVDHELLHQKLAVYNFSAKSLSWIPSYLGDRQQCIKNTTTNKFTNEAYLDVYADGTTVHAESKS